jgi:hypothetical protein
LRGTRDTVSLELAARLEDTLGESRGNLFRFSDEALAAPYIQKLTA